MASAESLKVKWNTEHFRALQERLINLPLLAHLLETVGLCQAQNHRNTSVKVPVQLTKVPPCSIGRLQIQFHSN